MLPSLTPFRNRMNQSIECQGVEHVLPFTAVSSERVFHQSLSVANGVVTEIPLDLP